MKLRDALAILSFGLLPFVAGYSFLWRRTFNLQEVEAITLFATFWFAVIETFAIIVLSGMRKLYYEQGFLKWMAGITVGELAGLVYYIVKSTFPLP